MKVLVTGRLPEEIMARLVSEHEVEANHEDRPMGRPTLLERIEDKEGLLCMVTDRINDELLEKAPKLRMIANYGVGYDNVDLSAVTARGIWVSNTPGVLTDATADLTIALILAVARRVVEGDARVRAGRFQYWAPLLFLGHDVSGKTLGIIGLGQIGKAVARRARAFNMSIVYHNRNRIAASEEREFAARYVSIKELLALADFVSLHVSLSQETRHLIGGPALKMMKPSAYLINASRGPVVDEKALVEALRAGVIAGAGLDVYEREPELTPGLTELRNVVVLPHVGSATLETRTKMAALAAENLLTGLRGEVPPNCLNAGFR